MGGTEAEDVSESFKCAAQHDHFSSSGVSDHADSVSQPSRKRRHRKYETPLAIPQVAMQKCVGGFAVPLQAIDNEQFAVIDDWIANALGLQPRFFPRLPIIAELMQAIRMLRGKPKKGFRKVATSGHIMGNIVTVEVRDRAIRVHNDMVRLKIESDGATLSWLVEEAYHDRLKLGNMLPACRSDSSSVPSSSLGKCSSAERSGDDCSPDLSALDDEHRAYSGDEAGLDDDFDEEPEDTQLRQQIAALKQSAENIWWCSSRLCYIATHGDQRRPFRCRMRSMKSKDLNSVLQELQEQCSLARHYAATGEAADESCSH